MKMHKIFMWHLFYNIFQIAQKRKSGMQNGKNIVQWKIFAGTKIYRVTLFYELFSVCLTLNLIERGAKMCY